MVITRSRYTEDALAPGPGSFGALREAVASAGEPFVSGFDPQRLAQTLGEVGLDLVEDLDTGQLVNRYDPLDALGLRGGMLGHLARARVSGDTSRSIP